MRHTQCGNSLVSKALDFSRISLLNSLLISFLGFGTKRVPTLPYF